MIDFQKLWAEGKEASHGSPEWEVSDLQRLKERSDSPIKTLKRNIHINSGFAIAFLLDFMALVVIVDGFWFRFFTVILSISYVASIVFNYWIIQKYLSRISHNESIFFHLKTMHSGMTKAFKAQELSSILIFPIAMTAGFLLPLTLTGQLDLFDQSHNLWLILFALYIVLTPLCYLLGKYLNKLSFGKYIKQIGTIVEDIEHSNESPV